jgi:FkbM family methyltransferase
MIINKIFYYTARVLGRLLARNYRSRFIRKTIMDIKTLYSSALNVDFNIDRNGEKWLLKKISKLGFRVFFDVGANKGDYLLAVIDVIPDAIVHTFEILPNNSNTLSRLEIGRNIFVNEFGLSNSDGEISVWFNNASGCDPMATSHPKLNIESENNYYTSCVRCPVKKGSKYIEDKGIDKIDFLKIDVEGHELNVIKGFDGSIRHIRLIQFEFGYYNIVSHDLLSDFFDYLTQYDFIIGRLFPRGVVFFKYDFSYESFDGGNYIAINKDDIILRNLISI